MLRIKKDDKIIVIAGKDKGKTGKVVRVIALEQRVVVETINMAKKAVRKTQQNPKGGIVEVERPIHVSNVMLVDKNNKRTRFGVSILKDGSRVRINKRTKETI